MELFLALPTRLVLITLAGAALAGIACGLIGVFVVRMNLTSVGFTMSHAAFAGAALGLILSVNPLLMAIGFSIAVAALLGPISRRAKLSAEVIMGVAFPLSMALALIFLNFAPGTAMSSSALSLLWGSLLGMSFSDLLKLLFLTAFMTLLVILFAKEFQALMFERKLAKASGIPTEPFYYLILFLTGFTVSLALKLVGGLLIFTLMVNPASTIYQFSYDLKRILVLSPILGAGFALLGVFGSFLFNLPLGGSIAILSTLAFAAAVVVSPKRRKG